VKFKPILVVESGIPLLSRIEWPIPEIDNENGLTNAGIGDLTWLPLFLLGSSKSWGMLGMGRSRVSDRYSQRDGGRQVSGRPVTRLHDQGGA